MLMTRKFCKCLMPNTNVSGSQVASFDFGGRVKFLKELALQYKKGSETHLGAAVFLQLNTAMLANRTTQ